jgi:nucleoside 2-deoxyribosyltransferase
MLSVYLAGPISGLSYDDATGWRDEVQNATLWDGEIEFHDPMRGKGSPGDFSEPLPVVSEPMGCRPKEILTRDLFDIDCCDVVLANLSLCPRVSIGTMVELGYAKAQGKVIIVVVPEGSVYEHPFVTELANVVYRTLEDAVDYLSLLIP